MGIDPGLLTDFPEPLSSRSDEWPWVSASQVEGSIPSESTDDWPRITIVTPSFNQGAHLEKTIRSVLLQGYPNLEYLIMDGGSDDGSVDIIKRYEGWITRWKSEPDEGQSAAINEGLSLATGSLLGWLNSDDFFMQGALFEFARAFKPEDNTIGAYYGRGNLIDHRDEVLYSPAHQQVTFDSLFDWTGDGDFLQPSCLFTSDAWRRCGPLDESIHISLDVDLWLKIASQYRFERIDKLLSAALHHADAKTVARENEMIVDLAFVYIKHGRPEAARNILEAQANRLTEYDELLRLSSSEAILKGMAKMKRLVKSVVRYRS